MLLPTKSKLEVGRNAGLTIFEYTTRNSWTADWQMAFGQQGQTFQPFDQKQMDEFLRQSEKMSDSFKDWTFPDFKIDPKDMEQFQQSLGSDQFKFDPKQMEQMQQDMEQFRQSFDAGQFKIDPKQMEELQQQMDEFRKSFPQNFKQDRHQLEEFHRQLNQLRGLTIDQTA